MTSLFQLFFKQMIRPWIFFIIISILGVLFFAQFEKEYQLFLVLPFVAGALLAGRQMSTLIQQNLNWIMALPFSKRKILIFNYLFSLLILTIFLFSTAFVISAVNVIKIGGDEFFRKSAELFVKSWGGIKDDGLYFANFTKTIYLFLLIHWMCMIPDFSGMRTKISNHWSHSNPKLRQKYRAKLVIILLIIIFIFYYLSFGFALFILFCTSWLYTAAMNSSLVLGMSAPQRNKIIGGSLALAACLIFLVYKVAVYGVEDEKNKYRVESILYLGPLGKNISQNSVVKMLESDLSPKDVDILGNYYLRTFHKNKPIGKNQDTLLRFDMALESKKTDEAIWETLYLFDLKTIDFLDLKLFFEKMAAVSKGLPHIWRISSLMFAKISTENMISFLDSKNDWAIHFALIRSRYFRDQRLITVIEKNLPDYKDDIKISALTTLSILSGQKVGLNFLKKNDLKLSFLNLDCSDFKIKNLKETTVSLIPKLNICSRQEAVKMEQKNDGIFSRRIIGSFEDSFGWIDFPISSSEEKTMQRIFDLD